MAALIVSCCKGRNSFNLKTEFSTSFTLLDHGKSEKHTNIWIRKLQYLHKYKIALKINCSTIKNFNKKTTHKVASTETCYFFIIQGYITKFWNLVYKNRYAWIKRKLFYIPPTYSPLILTPCIFIKGTKYNY